MNEHFDQTSGAAVRAEVLIAVQIALEQRLDAAERHREDAQSEANSHVGAMESRYDTFKEDAQYLAAGHERAIARISEQLGALRAIQQSKAPAWPKAGALVVLRGADGTEEGRVVLAADVEPGFAHVDRDGRQWRVTHPESKPGAALLAPFESTAIEEALAAGSRRDALAGALDALRDVLERAGVAEADILTGVRPARLCSAVPPASGSAGPGGGILEELRKDLAALPWPGALSSEDRNAALRSVFVEAFAFRFPKVARARLAKLRVSVPRTSIAGRIQILHETVARALAASPEPADGARWHRFMGDVLDRLHAGFVLDPAELQVSVRALFERWSEALASFGWETSLDRAERREVLDDLFVLRFAERLGEQADEVEAIPVWPGGADPGGGRPPTWRQRWEAVRNQVGRVLRARAEECGAPAPGAAGTRWSGWAEDVDALLDCRVGKTLVSSWRTAPAILEQTVLARGGETTVQNLLTAHAAKAWRAGAGRAAKDVARASKELERAINAMDGLEDRKVLLPEPGEAWIACVRRAFGTGSAGARPDAVEHALAAVQERRRAPGEVAFDEPSLEGWRVAAVL